MQNFGLFIPARFGSSRFPGKPLSDICGTPMIVRVANNAMNALGPEKVFVVTDHHDIEAVCIGAGIQVIRVDDTLHSGTDRVARAVKKLGLELDWIFNLQGDEPMLAPKDITSFVSRTLGSVYDVTNAYFESEDRSFCSSSNRIKIAVTESGRLAYASRAAIPFGSQKWRVQACIYGFQAEALSWFASCGRPEGGLEELENVELLRFLDAGRQVEMLRIEEASHPVDTPEDAAAVRVMVRELESH